MLTFGRGLQVSFLGRTTAAPPGEISRRLRLGCLLPSFAIIPDTRPMVLLKPRLSPVSPLLDINDL